MQKDEILTRLEKEAKEGKNKKEKVKKEESVQESGAVVEDETENIAEEEVSDVKIPGVKTARYKGLGEMNPSQLWETTMDPENRVLLQVKVEDAEKANEVFSILMGDVVEPRKKFIQTHAKNVKNLDV